MKSAYPEPILQTKLFKPIVKDNYVIRKSIIDKLEQNRHNPFTLVVAPAGYGKSVTISQWLDHAGSRYCWVSLDDEFNDVLTFFYYLVHAVRTVFPGSLPGLYDLVHGTEVPPLKILIRYLINELNELPEELIVVFDDYYVINNYQIHEIINEFINNLPLKIKMVVISRRDPPININKIRSYDNLTELRMSGLSFSAGEIYTLAEKNLNIRLSKDQADLLKQKTEGWIVGLRMTLFHMSKSQDIEKAIEELIVHQQSFRQYLVEDVLRQQPLLIRKLLLAASITDRFSRELLETILNNEEESAAYPDKDTFDQLITSTMFIIPLDEDGQWYRFHHFFHDFLLKQFEKRHTEEEILVYHKKASRFFEKTTYYEQAIRHAVKSGDVDLAIQIFERHKHELLNTDQFARLEKWLQIIPSELVEQQPQFLLTRALLRDTRADYQSMQKDLSLAKSYMSDRPADSEKINQLWGEFYAANACLSFMTGNVKNALQDSQKALEGLSNRSAYLRVFAKAFGSFALQNLGNPAQAIEPLKKELINLPNSQSSKRTRILALLSILHAFEGNLPELHDSALQYRSISLENKLFVTYIMATYFITTVCYMRNELTEIKKLIAEIQNYRYAGRPFWVLNCMFFNLLRLQAEGKIAELKSELQEVYNYVDEWEFPQLGELVKAFEVELALRQDRSAAAWELSKNANFEVYPLIYYYYFPQLTYVKLLMVSNEPAKISEAENRLKQLVEFGYSNHRKNFLNQALALQALFYQKAGKGKKAMKIFNNALTFAKPGGYIRNFLDLGMPMQVMIKSLYQKKPQDVYLASIYRAFKQELTPLREKSKEDESFPTASVMEIEKITKREVKLLQLVADGYQNKEIAEKLFVAPDSIKKSLYRLYQKLNVHNRTSAISNANKLGLLRTSPKNK